MARKATEPTAWLPGFDPEDPTVPDLVTEDQAPPRADPPISARLTTSLAELVDELSTGDIATPAPEVRLWRPTLQCATVDQALAWPAWDTDWLEGLQGQATKFAANLSAIRALREIEATQRAPTPAERRSLLRFTGWGGIPASFNVDGKDTAWRRRAAELAQLLTPQEYEAARASVNNSHYTEPRVVAWIWAALRRIGFAGGRVLEPSAGIGHFLGCMPPDMAAASRVAAVELDDVAGRILKALYGPCGVDVRIGGFEEARLPDEWFDLIVSNVPFGNYQVADGRNRPFSRFNIHSWFFGRALELVRPGGLVCFITSAYFLDANGDEVRAYIASLADLLCAVRLPAGTFERLASTDVQADIVILRKRDGAEQAQTDWTSLAVVPETMLAPRCHDRYMRINAWYVARPDHVIGNIDKVSRGYEAIPTAVLDGDLDDALARAAELVPVSGFTVREAAQLQAPRPEVPAGARPGSFVIHDGRVHRAAGDELVEVHDALSGAQQARIAGMCEIRDRTRELLELQLGEGTSDDALSSARRKLTARYDAFVRRHGCLSSRANALAFRRDPDYPLLLSLEHYDEESDTATKADIFSRRTVSRVSEPVQVAEPEEALACSMQWRGAVVPSYMARLLRANDPADVTADLHSRGLIFLNPSSGAWETADEYLSGNVKAKLVAAIAGGTTFHSNVVALEKVIPMDLPPSAIEARLGAVWIPAQDVEAFMAETLGLQHLEVKYSARAGTWSVKCSDTAGRVSVRCTREFGTSRMDAVELVTGALNLQMPTVRDWDPVLEKYVVNKEETVAAREKLGLLKEQFASWAFEDLQRRERLCRLYNDAFNATRPRRFDGSHLKLPGFSACFVLHPHQKDAIWRIVVSGNTGLFHVVGAGKTAVMVAASMEMRRLGLANKPCHVVPNHMLLQYTAEFVRLYPGASVLMATKDDLEGDRRRELVSRIATGDWDAVVLTQSTFERIKMSPEFTERFVKDVIFDLEMAVRAEKQGDRSNRIVKQLEAMKKNWKARLERLMAEKKKDVVLTWEMLGIDTVCYDEAHAAKNLWRHTKMTRVAGLPLTNSERAFDLFVKTRHIMALHDNGRGAAARGVVLATATPVANTMAEIHTMQRFLQPNRLAELGLQQFDAWAATFGESVTALEIAPDGSGYRMHTRFARFINVPELMSIFGEVADIRTADMLKLPVPAIKGGKPRVVSCRPGAALKAYVQTLVKRAEAIRNGQVKPHEDNMLAVTTDGRKAALDYRLADPSAIFDNEGKVARCTQEVFDIWCRTAGFKGTQLVFCDLSSPKYGKAFSVYEDLRDRLIERGIPEREIAFIHDAETDAQKAALFRAVREGRVRVLLGSTQKMGVGTNVHTRLYALHHLDAPWRPCDVEQREGRIVRQGSTCDEVEIIRYVTEGSFDAYSWQTLLAKAKFIAQVMSGDKGLRSIEDVELATLSYAEVKALASGNPLVIEKAGVDAEVARLSSLFSVWRDQRYSNERQVASLPMMIESTRKQLDGLKADAQKAATVDATSVTVRGRMLRGPQDVGDALRVAVKDARAGAGRRKSEEIIGEIGKFELGLVVGGMLDEVHLFVKGTLAHDCQAYQTGPALYGELVKTISSIAAHRDEVEHKLTARERQLEDLKQELQRPFEHEARLTELLVRQRELLRDLDLDKDEAGSVSVDDAEELPQAA